MRLLAALLIAGCELSGEPSGPSDAAGTVYYDARGTTGSDGGATADALMIACRPRKTTGFDSGHHNPGQDCQGACHDHGFAMSGTLYANATGGGTVSGVSITVVDSAGQEFDMVTSQNGNFWWPLTVVYPARVFVSGNCPTVTPMNTPLQFGQGACSTAACHAGPAGRVHL